MWINNLLVGIHFPLKEKLCKNDTNHNLEKMLSFSTKLIIYSNQCNKVLLDQRNKCNILNSKKTKKIYNNVFQTTITILIYIYFWCFSFKPSKTITT